MDILTILVLVPLITIPCAVYAGGVQTFCDWLGEKIDDRKLRKEAENLRKEREALWNVYCSLSQDLF